MTERGRRLDTLDAIARHSGFDVPFTLTNNVTYLYVYDAFGNIIARSGSTFNNLLYCGEYRDPDLGLYFLRARYMDTDRGRFWTMDTFEGRRRDPLSLHKYLYANGSPIALVDPSGNMTLIEILFGTKVRAILTTLAVASVPTILYGRFAAERAFEVAELAEDTHFPPGDPYGGAFRHCVAANQLARRFTRGIAWILVRVWDRFHEDPDSPNSLGDMYGEQVGLRGRLFGISSADVCLEEFPSPEVPHPVLQAFNNP